MILYLDSSALVKIYVREEHSDLVRKKIKAADAVATSAISCVEARSAFARLLRAGQLTEAGHAKIKNQFMADWETISQVRVTSQLIARAADAAETLSLRAYDGIQLASAEHVLKVSKEEVWFGCFGKKLNRAAQFVGLKCFEL